MTANPTDPPSPKTTDGQSLGAMPCCARFSFVRVTTPGCDGTINLMWDEYPVAWINSVQIAREIMAEIPEHNTKDIGA